MMRHFVVLVATLCVCFGFSNAAEFGKSGNYVRKVSKPIWNETYTDALKRDLLMSYDKFARPHQHYDTTKVEINLRIKHIDFDENTCIFTVYAWFVMRWVDEKLKWDPEDYGNLKKISFAQHEIWQPDIALYNSINSNDYYGSSFFNVIPNGSVIWVPPSTFKIFCDPNLRYWPYDTHKCSLLFSSWVANGHEIDIVPKETDEHLLLFVENPEWEIIDFTASRSTTDGLDEIYIDVRYNITIERRASIHRTVIVAPSFVIILFILTIFWLPTDHGQKLILNGVTAVIVCIYLNYFSQKLKAMAENTPLIVTFYCHTFFLVSLSTIISAISINLSRMKNVRPLPWIIKKHLDGILGDYLLLHQVVEINWEEIRVSEFSQLDESSTNDDQQMIQQCGTNRNSVKIDYLKLATAIDRIAFLAYLLIFTFMSFSILHF